MVEVVVPRVGGGSLRVGPGAGVAVLKERGAELRVVSQNVAKRLPSSGPALFRHWRDAFRTVHGVHRIAYSHRHNSGARWLNDHAFVPPNVQILGCDIDWSPIDESLSDHATLLLEVKR